MIDKLAGNDSKTDHKTWNDGVSFVGWPGAASPTALVDSWFASLEQNAIAHANAPRKGPGDVALPVYVTDDGLDLKQLVQKFLTGAVAYSQGTDDYLDDDVPDKGLLSANTRDGQAAYTTLEHAWDEGFGYFGSARHFNEFTDEEIAAKGGRPEYAKGYHDANCDQSIDLVSEYNFGHSVNAAKRDLGSASSAPTDFTKEAFDAFVAGRAIIAKAGGTLTAAELDELKAERDKAVLAWEKAIASTVVHYINEVLQDMAAIGTADYSYLDHVKHWGELKGFALALQFNPRMKLGSTEFATFHTLVGQKPVLESDGVAAMTAYKTALLQARGLLKAPYGFDDANMGDDNGENGW